MLKFSEDHEWALEGDVCTVGISPHAVEQLGDIVFIELPEAGANVAKGEAVAVFEWSKLHRTSTRLSAERSPRSISRFWMI